MQETRIAGFPALVAPGRRDLPLVVMLHGAFCTQEPFRPWIKLFSEQGFRVVAVSRRGRLGVGPAQAEGIEIADYLEDTRQVIEALGEKPILVGHSLGGLIAQKMAEEDRCAAIVLVAPAPAAPLVPALSALPSLSRLMPGILMGKPLAPSLETSGHAALNRVCPTQRRRIQDAMVHESGTVFRQMMLGRIRVDPSKVRCPVLVLGGRDDLVVPPRLAKVTADHYGTELVMYENNGHWLPEEEGSDAIASGIIEWIEAKLHEGALPAQPSTKDMLIVTRAGRTRSQ